MGVVIIVAVVVYMAIAPMLVTDEMRAYVNDSQDWCEAEGGELVNAQVMGEHGGLHCHLPNGTSVHMHEVADHNFTHNWSEMDESIEDPYSDQPWYAVGMMPVLLITAGLVLVIGITLPVATKVFGWGDDEDE